MAFNKKTWVNRVVQYPLRRLLTIVRPFDTTGTGVMDIQREDGEVTTEGDAFSAANMNDLESRIETAFNGTASKDDIIPKVTTMPTASADNVGTQVTYVGATDSSYTKGYTYECQLNNNVYSWVHIGATEITVDSALSSTSTNPLQNKKVFSSLQNILGNLATYHVGNKATSAVTSGSYVVYGNPDNPHFAVANTAISSGTTFNSGTGGNVTDKKVADVLTTLNNELNTHVYGVDASNILYNSGQMSAGTSAEYTLTTSNGIAYLFISGNNSVKSTILIDGVSIGTLLPTNATSVIQAPLMIPLAKGSTIKLTLPNFGNGMLIVFGVK